MPFPNFHVNQVRDHRDFQKGTIRTIVIKRSNGVRLLIGKLKGKTITTNQSYRFPVSKYTVEQAKEWLEEKELKCVTFHPAGKRTGVEVLNAHPIQMDEVNGIIEKDGTTREFASVLEKLLGGYETPGESLTTVETSNVEEPPDPDDETEGAEDETVEDDDGEGRGELEDVPFSTDPGEVSDEDEEFEKELTEEFSFEVPIAKINTRKRIVYGVVYQPEEPDSQNHFMNSATIETAAHRFMSVSRKVDEMHDYEKGAGIPVESFIVRDGDKDFVHHDGVKKGKAMVGAWVVGTKVTSDDLWKRVLKGEIKAYSLAGMASLGKTKTMQSRWYDDEGNRQDPYGDDKKDKK